jgi:hypothetical protein
MIFKNVQAMGCGGCGNGLFRMFQNKNMLDHVILLAECTKCGSVSSIGTSIPTVTIDWTEGSNGRLSVGDPSEYTVKGEPK